MPLGPLRIELCPVPACCPPHTPTACWLCRFVQTYKIPTTKLISLRSQPKKNVACATIEPPPPTCTHVNVRSECNYERPPYDAVGVVSSLSFYVRPIRAYSACWCVLRFKSAKYITYTTHDTFLKKVCSFSLRNQINVAQ